MKIATIITTILGLLGIISEVSGYKVLSSIHPDWVTMKTTTGLAFILLGSTIPMAGKSKALEFLSGVISILVITMMGEQLFANLQAQPSFLDVIVNGDDAYSVTPGRPSVGTMLGFMILGFFNLLQVRILCSITSYLLMIVGGIGILGYILSIPALYFANESSSAMAITTAFGFVTLGLGLRLRCKQP